MNELNNYRAKMRPQARGFLFISRSADRNAGGVEVVVELSALSVHVHRQRNIGGTQTLSSRRGQAHLPMD